MHVLKIEMLRTLKAVCMSCKSQQGKSDFRSRIHLYQLDSYLRLSGQEKCLVDYNSSLISFEASTVTVED